MIRRVLPFGSTSPEKTIGGDHQGDEGPLRDSGLRLPSVDINTSPVVIPPRPGSQVLSVRRGLTDDGQKARRNPNLLRRTPSTTHVNRPLPSSIASVLEATAIPVPRRNRSARDSRRLLQGNHVEDFSKLLMEGVKLREDELMGGPGSSPLDILLSPPEEIEKPTSETDDDIETPSVSNHSISTESSPSLEHDLDSSCSATVSTPPSSLRSPPGKQSRRPSYSENCAFDHPLLEPELPLWSEPPGSQLDRVSHDHTCSGASSRKPSTSRSFPRLGSTFKSNLTASLRAIKSAAQTVSAFATPPIQQDDFLTRSLFTITPKLTDDRRPPPMNEPPSPALRRYLNPIRISPAEMHIYHEYPPECEGLARKCPVSIQMQTYHRSGGHGRRKGSFHVSAPSVENDLLYDPEMPPVARQREPRENSDFLRMVVLEMNMRRSGKLRDDIPPRAKVWLPPRKGAPYRFLSFSDYDDDDNAVPTRWIGISIECV